MQKRFALLLMMAMLTFAACGAYAAEYDAETAAGWLEQFAQALGQLIPRNDALLTADPARAGEYLSEYDFGTVLAKSAQNPSAEELLRIDVKTNQVYDCRGLTVGMTLEDVIAGTQIGASDTPLYVLATQESGYGWSWAYVNEGGVYGVEYITYGGAELEMKEYTLTYVIENDIITAIRMQIADATLAQAQEGLRTAEEIAGRQQGEVLAVENNEQEFAQTDMQANGRPAVGIPVEDLVAALGAPSEVQELPSGQGRMLIYDDAVAELVFDEMTGVENVAALSCVNSGVVGPRGLLAGMSIQEAAALFRCDADVHSIGGELYLAGEAQGDAPYGEMIRDGAGMYTLRYACLMEDGGVGVLDIGVEDSNVTYWRLYVEKEAAYGG